ncbi:MAG: NADPH-dependent F420 reductase [Stellaceae bacterium]
MRILIVGAGNVGGALGQRWLRRGHDVRFGVPDPADAKYALLPKERLQRADERRGAEVIVLATPFAATKPVLEALGDLAGAIVIDCTNPLGMGPDGLHLTLGHDTSGAEQVASWAKGGSVFKTLNQTGAENMADAEAYHPTPVMFVAGDDAERKPTVLGLVADLGFDAVDAGPISAARLLEPFGMLWIELALKRGHGRDFAFVLARRPGHAAAPEVKP